jgi:hypothetical protein
MHCGVFCNRNLLGRTSAPLGTYRKSLLSVKWLMTWDTAELAKKNESYEICFVPG